MMVVADPNVFVSAAFKHQSWPAETLRWVQRYGMLLKSDATERECMEVLRRPRLAVRIPASVVDQIATMFVTAVPVSITIRIKESRDPTDDKFLELAINGAADVIVSGDEDLLVLDIFRGIPIVTPAAFCHLHVSRRH